MSEHITLVAGDELEEKMLREFKAQCKFKGIKIREKTISLIEDWLESIKQ